MAKAIKTLTLGLGLMLAVGSAGEAVAQNAQWNALFDRIIRLEANVKNMSRGGGGGGAGASSAQMRQMLNEIRQMRQQLLGMDARLRRLERNAGRSGKLQRPVAPAPVIRQPVQPRQYATNNNQVPFTQSDLEQYGDNDGTKVFVEIDKPGQRVPAYQPPAPRAPRAPTNWQNKAPATAPRAPGKVPGNVPGKVPGNVLTPPGQVAAVPPGTVTSGIQRQTLDGGQLTQTSIARRLYDRAASDLRSRRFGSAEAGFKSFLRKYSRDPLASGAQFMLGETYYVQHNYRLAAQTYLQGYRKYPKGKRAGDTLLKLGMTLGKLGQKSQSCGAFETVVSKYKNSPAVVSQARKEMKRGKC